MRARTNPHRWLGLLISLTTAMGCAGPAVPAAAPTPPPAPSATATVPPPESSDKAEKRASDRFVVHVVDVGTGLGIFVEGPGFALVYDAGSNDDKATGPGNRFVSYLRAARPDLQVIDHVIIGHPHDDHVSLMPDLFQAFTVRNVWDSGAETGICAYEKIIKAVVDTRAAYHSAASRAGTHRIRFTKACAGMPDGFDVESGDQITTGMKVDLGPQAAMTFLHVDGRTEKDPNDNSLVVRLDLGRRRILLMGDAGAGGRDDADKPPKSGSIEAELLGSERAAIDADVLVVGHHGSRTSSRRAFLDAVTPSYSIISSGPKKYGTVMLPDPDVVGLLETYGTVARTDAHDDTCGANPNKVGTGNDGKPGGCDNVRVVIDGDGAMRVAYWAGAGRVSRVESPTDRAERARAEEPTRRAGPDDAATRPAPPNPATRLTDAQVAQRLIDESIERYQGNCPCPYNLMRNGRLCGGRSAWSRPGGEKPLCRRSDVTPGMIEEYRRSHDTDW